MKNNAYEFSTKVQAQLEQIELGIGDKFDVDQKQEDEKKKIKNINIKEKIVKKII